MISLIKKDLYNIGHNSKSMLFILIILAFVFIPMYGAESYIIVSGILCSMMIITTFSFDEKSNWMKYAMIMPVSKKDLVISKFIVLLIFSAIGVISGFIFGIVGEVILHKLVLDVEKIVSLLFIVLVGLVFAEIIGSMCILLVFKFGSDKGRMFFLISFFIPSGICFGVYRLLQLVGVSITDQFIFNLICISPMIALIWNYIMYKISLIILSGKEL